MAEFTKLKIGSTPYDIRDAQAVSADAIKDAGRYKGTYAASTTYAQGDIVLSSTTYYKSKKDNNKGHEPPNTTYWDVYTTTPGFLNAIDAFAHIQTGGGEPDAYLKSIADGTGADAGKVVVTDKNNTTYKISADKVGAATVAQIAPAYTPGTAYLKDDWVSYNGSIYQANEDIASAPDVFDATKWTARTAMTTPAYQFQTIDGENKMRVVERQAGGTTATKWSVEYKLVTESGVKTYVTLKTGMATAVTLGDDSYGALNLSFSTQDSSFARDLMLYVTLPNTLSAGASFQSIAMPQGVVPVWTHDNPFASFDTTKDLGKTFVYFFNDTPDGRMLVTRAEIKGTPTVTTVTGSAAGAIAIGSAATLDGTFLSGASKVEWSADATASPATWTEVASANYTVNYAGRITIAAAGTTAMTASTGAVAGIRVTTSDGTATKTGLTIA